MNYLKLYNNVGKSVSGEQKGISGDKFHFTINYDHGICLKINM